MRTLLAVVLVAAVAPTIAQQTHQPGGTDCPHKSPSPYVGEEDRAVKALSSAEREQLLTGQGMGLARAAELNRFPGPKHVLELASELELTADQIRITQNIFDSMHEEAVALGKTIVDGETALDARIASGDIDEASLSRAILEIGETRSRPDEEAAND